FRPPHRPALRRTAATRGAGKSAGDPTLGAAAGRTAVEPGCEAARGDPRADPSDPEAGRDHQCLRHPRSVRGDGDVRPHRGYEHWSPPPGRSSARDLPSPGHQLRRPLHRTLERPGRHRRGGGALPPRRTAGQWRGPVRPHRRRDPLGPCLRWRPDRPVRASRDHASRARCRRQQHPVRVAPGDHAGHRRPPGGGHGRDAAAGQRADMGGDPMTLTAQPTAAKAPTRRRSRQQLTSSDRFIYALAIPLALVLLIYIVFPMIATVITSLEDGGAVYQDFLSGNSRRALALSVGISLASVLTSGVVGTGLAVLLTRFAFPGRSALKVFALLPLALPPLIGAMSFYYLYGTSG